MSKDPAAVKLGRKGGKARGESLRAGRVPVTGAAARGPVPTECPRCGEVQESARVAWKHCRRKNKVKISIDAKPLS